MIFLFLISSFFHFLIKQKPDVREKIIPPAIIYFTGKRSSTSHTSSWDQCLQPINHIFFYYWIDQWICIPIYILLIYTCNQFSVSSTANSNLYYRLLLLLSVDICPYPGSFHNLQPLDNDEWNIYKHRGLYFLHLHIISLLSKIDELGT